jgi:hypothetical protein
MKATLIGMIVLVLAVFIAPAASAADDGNTQPKFSSSNVFYPNDAVEIISTTSGTGNVKGIRCNASAAQGIEVQVYINGGSAQDLYLPSGDTLWIPMNLRFTSSIRVRMVNGNYYQSNGCECDVSWALD